MQAISNAHGLRDPISKLCMHSISFPYVSRFKPGHHAVERFPRTFPITYSSSRYFERPFVRHSKRTISILCTLRPSSRDRERRNKVKEFLKRYVTERGIKDAILNPVSGGKCWIESI